MTFIVRQLRSAKTARASAAQEDFYAGPWTDDSASRFQLERFNECWDETRTRSPYFRRLASEHGLPREFASWEEVAGLFPVMDRKIVREELGAMVCQSNATRRWRSTGGSTAEPLRVPVWDSEQRVAAEDVWYARGWFGVRPADRLFLIWGHSHLLGGGARGWLNGVKRSTKDALLGYYRLSAYDLSDRAMRAAASEMLKFRPSYVLAYAVALDRFARANRDRAAELRGLKLKVAIATAECFPRPDSTRLVSEVLGCPVRMEYGAVETGPIAHQTTDGNYSVFWRHFFVEGRPSEHLPGSFEILVTSLYPRCLPLVRYRLGDLILPSEGGGLSREFAAVVGRCNDTISLRDGTLVHSEAFTHAVKESRQITNFQAMQLPGGGAALRYMAAETLDQSEEEMVRGRLGRIHSELLDIRLERVEALEQTLSGKTRRIHREN